jgi:hypothetical protein
MPKGYTEIPAPVVHGWTDYVYNKAYRKGDLNIWLTRDVYKDSQLRWHMSISTRTRYPVWDEIRDAWYALKPSECANVTMGLLLPPESEYVNVHPNCFHLHEIIE